MTALPNLSAPMRRRHVSPDDTPSSFDLILQSLRNGFVVPRRGGIAIPGITPGHFPRSFGRQPEGVQPDLWFLLRITADIAIAERADAITFIIDNANYRHTCLHSPIKSRTGPVTVSTAKHAEAGRLARDTRRSSMSDPP